MNTELTGKNAFKSFYLPDRQESAESRIATIVIRGSTDNYMDDIERAVDDAVNTFKGLCRVWIGKEL